MIGIIKKIPNTTFILETNEGKQLSLNPNPKCNQQQTKQQQQQKQTNKLSILQIRIKIFQFSLIENLYLLGWFLFLKKHLENKKQRKYWTLFMKTCQVWY